ncbi:hypothetical protein VmeM32_00195 [Vibrio phage vB_VmeM-32]|nr:hypothetical protein VmeM32_00195 [Vibrio phage vB_VmeM-32]
MTTTTISLKSGTSISSSTNYNSSVFEGFSGQVNRDDTFCSRPLSDFLSVDEINDINDTLAYMIAAKIAEKELNREQK